MFLCPFFGDSSTPFFVAVRAVSGIRAGGLMAMDITIDAKVFLLNKFCVLMERLLSLQRIEC